MEETIEKIVDIFEKSKDEVHYNGYFCEKWYEIKEILEKGGWLN